MSTNKPPAVRMAKPTGRPIQLRYTDPETGKEVRITTGTHDPEEAAEQKQSLEAKLLLGIDAKPRRRQGGKHMAWEDFRERYRDIHLAPLRPKTQYDNDRRLEVITRVLKPRTLADVANVDALTDLQSKLLAGAESRYSRPRSPHSVRTYMAVIVGSLNWAVEMGWLEAAPRIRKVKTSKLKHMKGRPLTLEEFERMLMVTPAVVGEAAARSWRFLLHGLWESGLRLDELMHVSWDDPNCIMPVWPRGSLPVLQIPAAMQKNDTEESIPMLAGLESILAEVPECERHGWVCEPSSLQTKLGRKSSGQRLTSEWVGKVVSRIGKKAGVIVQAAKGEPETPEYRAPKYASAHDLRRGLADRLIAAGVSERDVATVMRHASVETTRRHYAPANVQRTAGAIRDRMQGVPRYNQEVKSS